MTTLQIIPRESEAQWLGERQSRVTATDIGRLANGGPATAAAVKAEKHGENPFRGNRYTEYGHEREPFILAHLEFLHGITPNDALYVRGTDAATPDGVSKNKLAEAKTTVTDWWTGDDKSTLAEIRRVKPQYYDQMQWAQHVADVGETVFAWEPHENFVPGPLRTIIVPRDDARLAELFEERDRFLEYLAAVEDPGEWDAFMAEYVIAEAEAKEAAAVLDGLKAEFRERAGDREIAAKSIFGSISYSMPKPRESFDTTAFKKAHPEMWAEFMKTTPAKAPTLRITTK